MPSNIRSEYVPLPPASPLPLNGFEKAEQYVESLLSFITSSDLFQKLCGGVHVLDFLTNEPDLYSTILPEEWRVWFQYNDVSDILDLLMREDADEIERMKCILDGSYEQETNRTWRHGPIPPMSLLNYIQSIRKHALDRSFTSHDMRWNGNNLSNLTPLPRHVAVGMKPKKKHEVQNFAKYINELAAYIDESDSHKITHVVDFGSGQNYLGRALASPPYHKRVVALESKQLNISGAKDMDVTAKLAEKKKILRNKKEYRQGLPKRQQQRPVTDLVESEDSAREFPSPLGRIDPILRDGGHHSDVDGSIQYIETFIEDGDLSTVVGQVEGLSIGVSSNHMTDSQLLVVSLHSCGNLLHHGLRSLVLNPAVKAVAMVGCCYNLLTERQGPPTYKLPSLRSPNRRLDQTSSAYDPHGFPMSHRLLSYPLPQGCGIRMNITARMMAVQAPESWTTPECESFFTRHFYRALLQRILVDLGIVDKPTSSDSVSVSPRGWTGAGAPLTIGSLRKACYTSFSAYFRGATAKLAEDPHRGIAISQLMEKLTDEEIHLYEEKHAAKKKELSIIWSLMAFSASVVESAIVIDRWLYLTEQKEVKDCWVETVFDYKQSPRNLVVVGIKH